MNSVCVILLSFLSIHDPPPSRFAIFMGLTIYRIILQAVGNVFFLYSISFVRLLMLFL
jgi:hypothetical protein